MAGTFQVEVVFLRVEVVIEVEFLLSGNTSAMSD